mgnify:CR=1 FL=1
MSDRRPVLRRLGLMAFALVALTAFCRSRGINEDLPRVHTVTALVFPSLPVAHAADGAAEAEPAPPAQDATVDVSYGLPVEDALFVVGLAVLAVALATTLARCWTPMDRGTLSAPPGAH